MADSGNSGPDLGSGVEKGLFRRKPIDEISSESQGSGLRRSVGLWQLTAIGVGGIIGAGIFALAGQVANEDAGPGVLFSFLIAGVASAAAALSYSEFAGMIPRSGSAYTYGYAVLGEFAGWFIGWDLLLEYTTIVAVVAISISGYFTELLGYLHLSLPEWMLGAPGDEPHGTDAGTYKVNLVAVLLCLLVAWILNQGMRNAARMETVLVYVKVAIVLLVIVVGAFHIHGGNYSPFLPYGLGGAFTGAATVFFAVFGYDAMSTVAEESEESQKHMPKAILLSLLIAMVLYVLCCLVLTGMVSYENIDTKAAFAVAFETNGMKTVAEIISVGAVVGVITVLFTFMLGATRVWFSMSRDGLLPKWFAKTHPKRKVPSRITWILGGASAVFGGWVPRDEAAKLANIGILLAFIVVCTAVVVLRYRRPELPRAFRLPLMPIVPVIGVGFSVYLVTKLSVDTWIRFIVWFVIGTVVYFAYSRHNSLLNLPKNERPRAEAEITGEEYPPRETEDTATD